MLRQRDIEQFNRLKDSLIKFRDEVSPLPGIQRDEEVATLSHQLLDSVRRVQYVQRLNAEKLSPLRADPTSEIFDPLKAATLHKSSGDIEEAGWLTFLATHFGKSKSTGWLLARDVYGALGNDEPWTWKRVAENPADMSDWLESNYLNLKDDGTRRYFGNHRKYETLRPTARRFTGSVIQSYVSWVKTQGDHARLFGNALEVANNDPKKAFRILYGSMNVLSFARMAKFDYLAMIAKLGLAPIKVDSAYLVGATGALDGAKLLFTGDKKSKLYSSADLDNKLIQLGEALNIGMQEMEDAVCNWQKSPRQFIRFMG